MSLSVVVAGFGHAMPVQASAMVGALLAHCEERAGQAMQGAHQAGQRLPAHDHSDKHQTTAGCCESGVCPCPQMAAVLWEGAMGLRLPGHHSPDFAPLRSDYRSPVLERLIRPPII